MLELPAEDFDRAKAHPEEFVVLDDGFGIKYIARRGPQTPKWAKRIGCLMLMYAVAFVLVFIYRLLFPE